MSKPQSCENILRRVDEVFGPWAAMGSRSASGMKSSKFEQRVSNILSVLGVEGIVREVVVPVRISHPMRRILDRRPLLVPATAEVAEFQKHDTIDLRFDMMWMHESEAAGRVLMILEVDGSQHAKTHSWFNGSREIRGVSDTEAPPRPQCRDMIKDELISQVLAAHPNVSFYRVSPKYERDSHANTQALLRNLLTWTLAPTTDPAHLNPGIFKGMLPITTTTTIPAAEPAPPPQEDHHLRCSRSKSEPRRPSRSLPPLPSAEDERKMRTAYNRWCKSLYPHKAELISSRQRASDSRKRPRDDQGHVFDPKWFKMAIQWQWQQQQQYQQVGPS